MQKIAISANKKRIGLLLLFCLFVLALSVWLAQFTGSIGIRAISIGSSVFWGLVSYYLLTRLLDRRPGLVITDEGIIDNISSIRAGLIKWDNITELGVLRYYRQGILAVTVDNPAGLIARQSRLKRALLSANPGLVQSPVQISSSALNYKFEDLCRLLKEQLEAHQPKH